MLFLNSLWAHADSVFVELTASSGVSTEISDTVTELVRSEVKSSGEELSDDRNKADYVLAPSLLKLGSALVFKIDKLENGKVKDSKKLKANSTEELDTVIERVTHAIIRGSSVEAEERVGKIRQSEAETGKIRKQAARRWYLGFGPALASNLQSDGVFYGFEVAYSFDVNHALIRILFDSAFGEDAALFQTLALGMNFFLSDRDTSFSLGGDFGYAYSKTAGDLFTGTSAAGFSLGVGAGYSFFRTSNITMELMFRARAILNSNDEGLPLLYTLKLGVYF